MKWLTGALVRRVAVAVAIAALVALVDVGILDAALFGEVCDAVLKP